MKLGWRRRLRTVRDCPIRAVAAGIALFDLVPQRKDGQFAPRPETAACQMNF
jgi:hypothetical protein